MSRKWLYENRDKSPAGEGEKPIIGLVAFIAFVVIVLIMSGCTPSASAPSELVVNAADFGDAYPLTV